MEDLVPIFMFSAFSFLAGTGIFLMGFQSLRLKRFIETTPTSKVRSLAMGLVEVNGKVTPAEKKMLKSPLLGKDCVYYLYRVEEFRKTSKDSRSWVLVDTWGESIPFFLQDDTGSVLVDPKGASIVIPVDLQKQYDSFAVIPENLKAFLSSERSRPVPDIENVPLEVKAFLPLIRINYQVNLLRSANPIKLTELLIEPGDNLYILGYAGNNPYVEEGTAKDNVEGIMIQKGDLKELYYISDKPEKDVLKKLRWSWIGGLVGGGLLIVLSIAGFMLFTGIISI